MLRQVIKRSEERLRELGRQRREKAPELAIGRAYPNGHRKKRRRITG